MISEELFKNLKVSMGLYKEYLLDAKNKATDEDKRLFGVMMFKYGTLLAAKQDYEKMSIENQMQIDFIVADAEAFVEVVNEICLEESN